MLETVNPDLPESLEDAATLAFSPEWVLRDVLHQMLPWGFTPESEKKRVEKLADLARDEESWVRAAVADHKDLPPMSLSALLKDPDSHVRKTARKNPQTPEWER